MVREKIVAFSNAMAAAMAGGSFESLIDDYRTVVRANMNAWSRRTEATGARCLRPQRSLLLANHSMHFLKGVFDDPPPCTQRCQQALQDRGLLGVAPVDLRSGDRRRTGDACEIPFASEGAHGARGRCYTAICLPDRTVGSGK